MPSVTPTRAADLAREAAELVVGDRNAAYGDMVVNHQAIAAIWNGYLLARIVSGKPMELSAEDVVNMMESLKIARRLNGAYKRDNYVDGAGYAALAGEIRSRSV